MPGPAGRRTVQKEFLLGPTTPPGQPLAFSLGGRLPLGEALSPGQEWDIRTLAG